ncbi:hypothetical protein MUK42_36711 [Musa troglodytarum]|uniref:Uncharacterized protein n=1 Tax=Musa troglodytarum TaxID=320322 RepID=A0A9E7GKZ2_9LILI|nr:hypothetical protein MUK42_36711 [Musa troglodytarum]
MESGTNASMRLDNKDPGLFNIFSLLLSCDDTDSQCAFVLPKASSGLLHLRLNPSLPRIVSKIPSTTLACRIKTVEASSSAIFRQFESHLPRGMDFGPCPFLCDVLWREETLGEMCFVYQ